MKEQENNPHTSTQKQLMDTLKGLGIKNERVLKAISEVPRHLFVPEELQSLAYENSPLPIGYEQTISQPYIVAFMVEAANLSPDDIVLEIGTGSGYESAILSKLCKTVYSVEVVEQLGKQAAAKLVELGCDNVITSIASGFKRHKSNKKFDAIIVTAAPEELPQILVKQLKMGGRLIIPVGTHPTQKLRRVIKTKSGLIEEDFFDVLFVPMIDK